MGQIIFAVGYGGISILLDTLEQMNNDQNKSTETIQTYQTNGQKMVKEPSEQSHFLSFPIREPSRGSKLITTAFSYQYT